MIDIARLRAHYQGREERIRQTFRLFQEDAAQAMARLEAAIKAGETREAARAAHAMANLCGAIRAAEVADRARQLQKALSEEEGEGVVERLYGELTREIKRIEAFIADYGQKI